MFTSTWFGNSLTLEIDAANRSGGWAGASAIDALSLKTIGSFSGVTMRSSAGTAWSLAPSELNARGCAAPRAKAGTAPSMTRLCYAGDAIALGDNMLFTFDFTGTPALSAPHLKVHFVDAAGNKTGSLLSLDFPAQGASAPAGSPSGNTGTAPELIPAAPVLNPPASEPPAANGQLPVATEDDEDASEVPEPRTLGLMTAGLVMLGVARRRRK
ncbi:PEP-CTERM sorting domain-containing protein [Massilia sp. X63]|uniref:PEP-CTERM sorting domain-containing protein n=1 Tax=Massilia sp. X63 TaxID=3237285 RepID=UPI0034DD1B46